MQATNDLLVLTACGRSLESALIFSIKRSDWVASDVWDHPTFILRVNNDSAQIIETFQQPIEDSWASMNGTIYCPTNHGQLLIYRDGAWSKEKVCDRDESFGAIWGINDKSGKDDILFIVSNNSLFVRNKGLWSEHPMPEQVNIVYSLHGLKVDEVYICTDEDLLHWDGTELTEVEGPEASGVLVISDTEMIAVGSTGLYRWIVNGNWKKVKIPTKSVANGMVCWNNQVFIPTSEGVLCLREGVVSKVSDFRCNRILDVGDALLASGGQGGLHVTTDGMAWSEISLPEIESTEGAT